LKIRIDALDLMFSRYIRLKAGKCEYCGRYGRLECSHFIGRRKRATRWDERNVAALCHGCHQHLGENPAEHTEFFEKRLGSDELERMIIRANTPTKVDKEAIKEELKEKIKYLEDKDG